MQKTEQFALRLCLTLGVLSAFGFVLRWVQNIGIFDELTGLATESATQSVFLVAFSIVVSLTIIFLALPLRSSVKKSPPAFCVRSENKARRLVVYVLGLVLVLSAISIFLSSDEQLLTTLYRILALLLAFSGMSFMHIGASGEDNADSPVACLTSVVPVFFCCYWLIMSYRVHSSNPVIWAYSIEIIAIVFACMAFYFIAGFAFGKPRVYQTVVVTALAAFFCFMALGDTREIAYQACFFAFGVFFVVSLYNLITGIEYNVRSIHHIK